MNMVNTGLKTNVDDLNRIPPLDYSFKKLEILSAELQAEKPRGTRTKYVPSKGAKGKYITAAIWLNNNRICSTDGLQEFLTSVLVYPLKLTWLDLSFNRIECINSEVLQLPCLRILYLHGNRIEDLQMILQLSPLLTLRTLTLHGNPIDGIPSYRCYIVKMLTQLKNLDFVTIVPSERMAPAPVGINQLIESQKLLTSEDPSTPQT